METGFLSFYHLCVAFILIEVNCLNELRMQDHFIVVALSLLNNPAPFLPSIFSSCISSVSGNSSEYGGDRRGDGGGGGN